jgi:hypothetical protein
MQLVYKETISERGSGAVIAALVSGGEVLVRVDVPNHINPADVRITSDGQDVTPSFRAQPDGNLLGLVTGPTTGRNRLAAFAHGRFAADGRDGAFVPLADPMTVPADAATATVNGQSVPYIVRTAGPVTDCRLLDSTVKTQSELAEAAIGGNGSLAFPHCRYGARWALQEPAARADDFHFPAVLNAISGYVENGRKILCKKIDGGF